MNKLVSVALAGLVAAATVAATAGTASAGGWQPGWQPGGNPGWQQHHARPYYPGPRSYDPGPAIVTGAILGLTLGALATQPYYDDSYPPPPPPPVQYYPSYASEHFNWCAATYPTYNSATDTWTDFRGAVWRCVGP
ncbi:hypothetical protein BH10PSE9_BH10PSE9_10070 [soil metagenome]